jgi:autotransporter-associated beta strand protein
MSAGSDYDQIALKGGSLVYGGALNLVNNNLFANLTNTFSIPLFKGFGTVGGDFSSVTLTGNALFDGNSLSNNAGVWSWSNPLNGVTYSFNESNGAFIGWNPGQPEWLFGSGSLSQISPSNGSALVFDGFLSGTATNNAVTSLSGIIYTNTLSGSYTLGGSNLTLGAGGIVNNSSNAQTIAANLTLGANESFSAVSGRLNISGNITNNGYALSLNGSNATVISGSISGTGGLLQTGSGTCVLSGSNGYSGTTQINAGTLFANNTAGSALGTGSVTVNVGGILGGSGAIAGPLTIASGGTLQPGSSGVGTLSLNNGLYLQSGSSTYFLINSPNSYTSLKIQGGTVSYGGVLYLDLTSYVSSAAAGNVFSLFSSWGGGATNTNDFSNLQAIGAALTFTDSQGVWSGVYNGLSYQFSDATGNLTVSAVPEPSVDVLLGIGLLFLVVAFIRRSRVSKA